MYRIFFSKKTHFKAIIIGRCIIGTVLRTHACATCSSVRFLQFPPGNYGPALCAHASVRFDFNTFCKYYCCRYYYYDRCSVDTSLIYGEQSPIQRPFDGYDYRSCDASRSLWVATVFSPKKFRRASVDIYIGGGESVFFQSLCRDCLTMIISGEQVETQLIP